MVVEILKMANFLGRFVDDVFSILKRTHLENFFYHINNLDQNIRLAMEIALLKRNNGKFCALVYWKTTHTEQFYPHYSSHLHADCKESVVSSLLNRNYSIIINKDDLIKEKARINPVLKENGYQESIISKIFKRITSNNSLPQSQQQAQATDIQEEIRMSINIPYVEGTSEKLGRILRYLKIRCIF